MEKLVAPFLTKGPRRWEGTINPKPWKRKVTATFAHLETPQLVPTVINLLRLQTIKPYIIIVDTGSSEATCRELEKNRANDVEIHYIRSHAYRESSSPVAVACDLSQGLALTEYMFFTHVDCFMRNRSYIEEHMADCTPQVPMVGYEMSPRDWITDQWKGMVSHTATVAHLPTLHRLGLTWSMNRATIQFDIGPMVQSWPDTETCINLIMRELGIQPKLIGQEPNYVRYIDENLDHCRSFPGAQLYSKPHYQKSQQWITKALREANERIALWSGKPASRQTGKTATVPATRPRIKLAVPA